MTFFQLESKALVLNSSRAKNESPKYVVESMAEARRQAPRRLVGALPVVSIPAPLVVLSDYLAHPVQPAAGVSHVVSHGYTSLGGV